jgi:hypothetical protein
MAHPDAVVNPLNDSKTAVDDAVSGTRFAVSVGLVGHVWTNVFGQV